jgi:ADP-heptose:LPS heptosyltransferase
MIFVMRAGAIGDLILTLPALTALRRKFHGVRVLLAARADMLPFVAGSVADDVIPFDSLILSPLFTTGVELPNDLQARLSDIELAVLWLAERPARIVANSLQRLGVAGLLNANPLPAGRHAADHLLDTLAPLGITDVQMPVPWLTPPGTASAGAAWQSLGISQSVRVVALHVGSGGEAKRWPLSNFLTLARLLSAIPDVCVLLISGPAEEGMGELGNAISSRSVHLASPPLSVLGAILARCALYVGNDSGITHLAAALGVPTVALFGPSDPAIWGPRGPHVTIIRSPDARMSSLAVTTVWQSRAFEALADR